MIIIRSLFFNLLFVIFTLLLGVLFLPFLISSTASNKLARFWATTTLFLLRYICNVNIIFKNNINMFSKGNVFAVRHESALDTILFINYFKNVKYIMKKELQYIPLYGWFAVRCGHILVKRKGAGISLNKMLKEVENKLLENNKLIIFPHGTRIKPEQRIKIKPGIFAIYRHTESIIVPVYISSGKEWERNGFIKNPGIIEVVFHEPIEAGLQKRQFLELLEAKINP